MVKKSARQNRIKRREARRQRYKLINLAALGIVLLLAGAFVFWPRTPVPEVAGTRLSNQPTIGPKDAAVTITEFGDFTCSACRSWHQAGVLPQILAQYDGLVNLEWRDLPIITADSPRAAEAGQCAHDQGRFWDYLDRMYNEPGSSYTHARPDDLVRYAEDIGLEMGAFNSCLDSGAHRATVDFDLDFALGKGLRGTPSFMVNGIAVVGGNPQLIIQAIDAELSN